MGIYVTRSCPKCGYAFEKFERNYVAIGQPFRACPKCESIVIFDHVKEWGLLSFEGKLGYIFCHIFTNLFLSLFGLILVLIYYTFVLGVDISSGERTENFAFVAFLSYLLTFAAVSAKRTVSFVRQINTSRKRMEEQKYREELIKMGLIKEEM